MQEAIHGDLVAVRRAFMKGGHSAAIVELRRRWPRVTDDAAPIILERILAVPINAPKHAGRHQSRRDAPR